MKTTNPINKNELKLLEIVGDGNCFYRCISYFILGNQDYYAEIKNEIIKWIDNNREAFNEFFGDDDQNKKTKEELAEKNINM